MTQKKHLKIAFDGEGAKMYGGRWNSKGTRMVYVANSLPLATLEVMVHAEDYATLKELYSVIPVEFDDKLIEHIKPKNLPPGWNSPVISPLTQKIGDEWVDSMSSAIFEVPSVIVPSESNYLLNPAHPDYKKLKIGNPFDFYVDPRL